MLRRFRLGTILGFPIEVNLSFLIMLGVVLLWMGGLPGVFSVLVAFASVLAHELGHAVVARRLGVPVPGIELHFFGGAAKLGGQPKSARDEIAIAAAGPAVSFVLAAAGWLLYAATGLGFFELVAWVNLILGAFNLVPALPMDGGRIFRALLSYRFSFLRATELSIYVARGFAVLLGVAGLAASQFYFVLLAGVIWWLGSQELRAAELIGGYAPARYRDDVEVLPRDYDPDRQPPADREEWPPPGDRVWPRAGSGFVVRQRGRRVYVQIFR